MDILRGRWFCLWLGLFLICFVEGAAAQPATSNSAIGYVCESRFVPLTATSGFDENYQHLYHTRMQEAMAPQPVNLSRFQGKIILVSWQVAEGNTYWGVRIEEIPRHRLKVEILPKAKFSLEKAQ